jgi:hypothetical protein
MLKAFGSNWGPKSPLTLFLVLFFGLMRVSTLNVPLILPLYIHTYTRIEIISDHVVGFQRYHTSSTDEVYLYIMHPVVRYTMCRISPPIQQLKVHYHYIGGCCGLFTTSLDHRWIIFR